VHRPGGAAVVRILHVIHRYPPAIGGGELWCAGLAAWQAAQGHDVDVLTLRATGDDELWGPELWRGPDAGTPRGPRALALGRHDRRDGVAIRRCAVEPPNWALGRALARLGLDSLAWGQSAELYGCLVGAARRADVVHGYWLSGIHAVAALAAARLARRRYVVTPFFHAGYAPHDAPAARALLRRADAVVALTAAEVDALQARGVARARIVLAGNAVAAPPRREGARLRVRADLGIGAADRVLCYVGRKAPNKGLDVLLDAVARLPASPWLVLAGPATQWYRDMLARHDRRRIVDLPPVSEAAKFDLLAAADALVLPSRLESFGSVFLEAWAAGTAVVGADVAAVREVVGDAGLLFRADDADDLARTIRAMLDDPEARRASIARGAARLAAHSWDVIGPRVLAAYALDPARPA
jgi:D-inositol-3-phosphate glycosyltransferase